MRRRLSRPQLLDAAEDELARLYDPLWEDFLEFYPQLMRFAEGQRSA
jgi:acyl carrier protein phosphodiesterase